VRRTSLPRCEAGAFTGGGAPEPAALFGLALMALLLGVFRVQERSLRLD